MGSFVGVMEGAGAWARPASMGLLEVAADAMYALLCYQAQLQTSALTSKAELATHNDVIENGACGLDCALATTQ